MNAELLSVCRLYVPSEWPVFVVDGTDGCFGIRAIRHIIENAPGELIILLDEDAFIFDLARLRRLVTWFVEHRLACVGMCDGGIVPIRKHNPNAMNPFFNILDLAQIRAIWDRDECKTYVNRGQTIREMWPPANVLTPGVEFQFDDFETYYCFYFWMRAQGLRLAWLTGETHRDGISTILHDHERQPFLLHTWYGRLFTSYPDQRQRILDAAWWAACASGKALTTGSSREPQRVE